MSSPDRRTKFTGCLLGGAIGDALGAGVQFVSLSTIRSRYGPQGIESYQEVYGRRGAITAATQRMLFTADGLIRRAGGQISPLTPESTGVLHRAYLRWLHTQGRRSAHPSYEDSLDGWLIRIPGLHSQREPGRSCIAALSLPHIGTPEHPINDSRGCGALTRVAPVGLWGEHAFDTAVRSSALTHGDPIAYLSAGLFAVIVERLAAGNSLLRALPAVLDEYSNQLPHELEQPLRRAITAAIDTPRSAEALEQLGEGWRANEAVSIAVYAALSSRGFADGIRIAVNHSGNSRATGALAGQLLGALLGMDAIDPAWLVDLELRDEIVTVAEDLVDARDGRGVDPAKYPTA